MRDRSDDDPEAVIAALRASEERFRVVARATNDAIWERDLATGEVRRGETFHALFGYRPEEVEESESWWMDRVHPDDRARIVEGLTRWRASGEDAHGDEYRFRRADGTWAHVFDRGVLMRDEGGRPVRVIGAMMDITARKKLEAKVVMSDRLAALGTLAAGVAHEINNPLSYVIANVRLIEAELRRLAAAEHHDPAVLCEALLAAAGALDEAKGGAERVQRIVSDLKTFACGEEEQKVLVDVRRVLDAALDLVAHDVAKHARLVRRIEPLPPILANEARLGHVFLTLVVNAAESVHKGDPDRNEVRVVARAEDGRVLVEVWDNGPGIAAEARTRIFEPFFTTRADGDRKGLGLSTSHSIVTALGGELHVESEIGRGTCFRVILPAASEAAPAPRTVPPAPSPGPRPGPAARGGAHLLVVDDEPMVGRMVERALGHVHRVQRVTSGKEALDLFAAGERFDVILCDVMMPGMSGMELHERLGAIAPDQADRMIFLSGGAFTPRAREFLARHPSLDKPFDLAALEAAIAARRGT